MNNFQVEILVKKLKRENKKTFVLRSDKYDRPLVMLNRLTEAGKAEQHDWAVDITYILEGKGKLERGGIIIDKVFRSEGEWRGSALGDSERINLKPGMIVITEAGVPHRTIPQKNTQLIFITYKQYTRNYRSSS